jgi:hypothetical protein
MALSNTARRILAETAQHPLRLAAPPDKLPTAARRPVLNNLLKQGYVEGCTAPMEYIGFGWRKQDGARTAVRATEAGLLVIGAAPATSTAADEAELGGLTQAEYQAEEVAPRTLDTGIDPTAPDAHEQAVAASIVPTDTDQEPGSAPLAVHAAPEAQEAASGAQQPSSAPARVGVRDAAHRVLAAWDDDAGERAGLVDAMAALRAILVKPAPAPRTAGPRKQREGTKQQQVLAMLRRPEGATIAQIMEVTGWQSHTVLGFFAGLKKRGIEVSVLERVRQVGPGKEGARGSYTVYRAARAR